MTIKDKTGVTSARNIVLVGFMGTGKTLVGKLISKKLGMTFLDMDDIIVERAGMPISQIFAEKGEPHFRSLERSLARELSAQKGLVIATGGGIVLNPENISDFSQTGVVICLSATPEIILKRVSGDTSRPLLSGTDKLKKIMDILKSRKHLYDAIPNCIDTTSLTSADVADRVIRLFSGNPS